MANTPIDVNEVLRLVQNLQSKGDAKELDKALWQREDVGIDHSGTRIVLPAEPREMSIPAGIDALQRRLAADNEIVQVREVIPGYAFDAAVAFLKAMKRRYGWANAIPTQTMFGPEPPHMLSVQTGPEEGDVEQIPLGSFSVPGIDRPIQTGIGPGPVFLVMGEIKNVHKAQLMQLIVEAKLILKTESIYKGKAIRLNVGANGHLVDGVQPQFIQTKHVRPEELILNRDVAALVETSLLTPIRHTEACRRHDIPLKRGIALVGPYGTGKSMTASITSRACVENGWTFVLLDKAEGLRAGLEFAKRYQPAVLFAEDIDRVAEERNDAANDLLNTIDGVLSKDAQVITVVTSNHPERINKAMLRPGRLDAVIQVSPPDAEAAQALMRLYSRGLIAKDEDLSEAGKKIAGQIPATIREVVERSKLGMISRGGDSVTQADLLTSVTGMQHHLELLNGKTEAPVSSEELFGKSLAQIVREHAGLNGHAEKIDEIHSEVDENLAFNRRMAQAVSEIKNILERQRR